MYLDSRFNPEFDKKTGYRSKACLAIPLYTNDSKVSRKLLGVVQCMNKTVNKDDLLPQDYFNEEDEIELKTFARIISGTLSRQLQKFLEDQDKINIRDTEVKEIKELKIDTKESFDDIEQVDTASDSTAAIKTGNSLVRHMSLSSISLTSPTSNSTLTRRPSMNLKTPTDKNLRRKSSLFT